MTDIDAAFMQQIFHVAQRKWESHIEHHRQADDFGTDFEVAKWVKFYQVRKVQTRPPRLKLICSDSARTKNNSFLTHNVVFKLYWHTRCVPTS